jgi:hypothetical protein
MYVATSKTLLREIEQRISNMRNTELKSMPQPEPPAFDMANEPWLRKLTWGPLFGSEFEGHKELTSDSGSGDMIRLHVVELDDLIPKRGTKPLDVTFRIKGAAKYFYEYGVYSVSREAHPWLGAWADNRLLRHECETRWESIDKKVALFLDNCKSLNEALKLWPDLAHYVPQEYIDKVNEKTEKKKSGPSEAALEALKAIDTDVVAQSNVLARMAGAPGVARSGA